MTNQKPANCPGYLLHTICQETGKMLFFTDIWGQTSYKQSGALILTDVEITYQAAATLEMETRRKVSASVNGDYLHGDKVRIKLSPYHHLIKSFANSTDSSMREKLTSYNEGIVNSTRWSNVDGRWIVLAEITITIKTPGRGKNLKLHRVTCTQAVDMEHLLTGASIISIKSNRASKYGQDQQKGVSKNIRNILNTANKGTK